MGARWRRARGRAQRARIGRAGRLAIVTQGRTPFDSRAAVRCDGDVVDELSAVVTLLGL